MLPTQVSYWTYLETKRHNMVQESQTDVANLETIRHNKATESYYMQSLAETQRHNRVGEDQTQQSIYETIRHNKATESIQGRQAEASMVSAQASLMSAHASRQQALIAHSRQKVDAMTALYQQRKLVAERDAAYATAQQKYAEANLKSAEFNWYDLNNMVNIVKPFVRNK